MHLTSLRLHGFKSFAAVTELPFRPGLTAIVGPNGSGKSNIADAIRWVLGEQSIRSLRGVRSQDVIFSGNDRRRALGFADVAIELDNSGGELPLDFTSVSISRRVHRTGESEFAINGATCRLRDIHELLTDTGLGRGGFFIMSQGEIDAVLSARPEDRRLLFEEVARTAGYRLRKRQALDRLEAARADRRRVSDLLDELERQAEQLEEQAREASRYVELKERLEAQERRAVVAGWRRWGPLWERAKSRLAEAERQAEAGARQLEAAEARLLEAAARRDAAEEGLGRAQQALHDAERELASCRHRLEVHDLQLRQLEQEEADLVRRIDELRRQWAEEAAERQENERALERIRREAGALARDVAASHREHTRREQAWRAAEQTLQRLRTEHMAGQQEAARLETELGRLQSRWDALREQVARLVRERDELEGEIAQLEQARAEARGAVAALEADQATVRERLAQMAGEAASREKNAADMERRLKELEATQEAEATRHRTLAAMEARQEGYQAGVRAVMQNRDRIGPGIIGPVGQLLDVEPRWQTAIETALGGGIQYIVTEDERAAEAAIAFLKERKAGRATFLPLNLLRVGPAPSWREEALRAEGAVGMASELVKVQPGAERAVQYLLGRTVVMEALKPALALSRRLPAGARIVTAEGELINPGGAVSGGAFGRSQGREFLARRQAMLDLAAAMKERSRQIEALREQWQQAAREAVRIRQALQEEEVRRGQLEAEAAGARRRVLELKEMGERLLARRRRLDGEMERAARDGKDLETRIAACAEALEAARARAADAHGQMEACAAEAERERRALEERAPGLNEAQARLAALEQEEAHRAAAARKAEAAEHRAAQRLREAEERRREMDRRRGTLLQEQEAERGRLPELEAALEAARQARQQAGAMVRTAREEGRRLEEETAALRRDVAARNSALQRARSEWERLDREMDNLRERAERLELDLPRTLDDAGEPGDGDDPAAIEREVRRLRAEIEAMPPLNLAAPGQLVQARDRIAHLREQLEDLQQAEATLRETVAAIDRSAAEAFLTCFDQVQEALSEVFSELFPGGACRLSLTEPDDPLSGGVEVHVQLPGKPSRHLLALSGGERALAAIALIFSLMRVRPAPFCVLDEVDASLDEANVQRFTRLLRAVASRSQVIAITHRRPTMEAADWIYGVTMKEAGISSIVSLSLEEVS